jgi:methyl-accepting chemotaxis protein
VSIEVNAMALALRDAVLIEMQEDLPVEIERMQVSEKRIKDRMDKLQALVSEADEAERLVAVQSNAQRFSALTKEYVNHLEGGARGPARGMLTGSLRKAQEEYLNALLSFRALQTNKVERRVEAVVSGMQNLQRRAIGAFAAILLVGSLVALAMMSLLARRLGAEPAEVARTMSQVAEGHLDVKLIGARFDGSVVNSLSTMVDKLREAVLDVRASAEEVSRQSRCIEQDSRHLSSRTEQQAADLEEASATLEQFAAAITHSANAVQGADRLALDAHKVSAHSQRTIDEAVVAMGRVGESSQKISEITSVIDSLAFQTNILALNAAVENMDVGSVLLPTRFANWRSTRPTLHARSAT